MRVLVAAGPSGGHVFPALSLLAELKTKHRDLEALLILPQKSIATQKEALPCKVKYIAITQFKFRIDSKNILAVFNFLKGAGQSLFILMDFRPDVVVGFGSLASIPVIIFAWLMRIPTLIHEQNVIPGRANSLLAAFSDRIAVSFCATSGHFQRYCRKTAYTGNPLRPELVKIDRAKALDFFGFQKDKFTILTMGGSQASHRINLEFSKSVTLIPGHSDFQVIHLCGKSDYAFLKQAYRQLNARVRLFEFLNPMHYAYSAADLVISRAGALTISEIIFFGVPAIIIPYPYAYAHQLANARVLEENGCAVIIQDRDLSADMLKDRIADLISEADKLKNMHSGYRNLLIPDAKEELARQVLALAA